LRDNGHAFGGGRILHAIDVVGGEVVGELDQRVLKGRKTCGAGASVAVFLQLAPGGGVCVIDELAHPRQKRQAELGILSGMSAGKLGGLVPQQVEVEIGRVFRYGLVHGEAS
jgi:hypothetical protein